MFEHLDTPQELYNHNLGAALKMENTVLEILDENIEHAQDEHLKDLFRHHEEETHEQIKNLELAFAAFGWEVDDTACPAIEGIQKEGKANVKKTDESLVDSVILAGAAETEHHEIAVYENLITDAKAMGKNEVVELLQKNLEQEQHTLEEVKGEAQKVAAATA
jgi:ferritin-like metal-binding protein YciE